MKFIFLTLAIYAHTYVVFGASTGTNHNQTSLEKFVEEKCFENSHNKYSFQNLNEAIDNFFQCAGQRLPTPLPHPVEQHDEFCRYVRESGKYTCMKRLAANVLPCLDKTEIFFPHMILKAYNTTYNTLCGTMGLLKTEYIFNKLERNRECINKAAVILMHEGRCIENLSAYKNFQQNVIDLNQHDYCIDMESFISCATAVVEEECNEDFTLIVDTISELFLEVCKTK